MAWDFAVIIRGVVQSLGIVASFAGVGLLAAGLVTPEWTTIWMHELKQFHQHGLWQDCVASDSPTSVMHHEFICSYKTYDPAYATHDQQKEHLGKDWQLITLIFCSVSGGLALLAAFFGFCASCVKCYAILWAALTTIAAFGATTGIIVFTKNTYDPQNLLILQGTETAEQHLGQSYWYAAAGCGILFLAAVLSIITNVLIFFTGGARQPAMTVYGGHQYAAAPMKAEVKYVQPEVQYIQPERPMYYPPQPQYRSNGYLRAGSSHQSLKGSQTLV